MEDQEAFRARAKPQATYESEASKGRPLLPVVRAVETIVEELLQWAQLMPKFGDRLAGDLPAKGQCITRGEYNPLGVVSAKVPQFCTAFTTAIIKTPVHPAGYQTSETSHLSEQQSECCSIPGSDSFTPAS